MRAYIFSQFYVGLSRCPKEYLYQSFFTLGYKNHTALSVVEIKSKGIKGRYFQRIMDERRARFHLLIHKYYCKYVSIHTYLSHYILSVSFCSLLSAIVHLLLQINVHKNMRTALFCVVYALPVFIIMYVIIVYFYIHN